MKKDREEKDTTSIQFQYSCYGIKLSSEKEGEKQILNIKAKDGNDSYFGSFTLGMLIDINHIFRGFLSSYELLKHIEVIFKEGKVRLIQNMESSELMVNFTCCNAEVSIPLENIDYKKSKKFRIHKLKNELQKCKGIVKEMKLRVKKKRFRKLRVEKVKEIGNFKEESKENK